MAVFVVTDPASLASAPMSGQAPPSSVLTRLRLETRSEHEAVEKVLDLMGATHIAGDYRQRLEQFYGFYAPLEAALQARCATPQLAPLLLRLNKTLLLQQDLLHLGVATPTLALCRKLPPLRTHAQVLGCMYVMEGATLGGRLITQHVQARFAILPATGGSFFEGYGAATGQMWQAMRQLLVSGSVDTSTENAIVASAIATFASLRGWCELTNAIHNNENDPEAEQSA
jgi:heme oxygenase